jgi:hypothetical protein
MLDREVIEEIGGLLLGGNRSYRAIARRLGVSRGAVKDVAEGKRRQRVPRARPRGDEFQPPRGLPRRCPGCGGKVKMPCLACYLRERNESNKPSKK